jgi:hypothetical protein
MTIWRKILCRVMARHEWRETFKDRKLHRDRQCIHCGKGQHTVNTELEGITLWAGGLHWKALKKSNPEAYNAAS